MWHVSRLVAEMPPTSGVITTPDVIVVKLVPDVTMNTWIFFGCLGVVVLLILFYILQQVVGVRITSYIRCLHKNVM